MASGADIDADAIVRWSLASFLSYLFGVEEWKPEYECLVQASWEWRKVRGAKIDGMGRESGRPACFVSAEWRLEAGRLVQANWSR